MTQQRGFTLIEMAIVLIIITILIGGLAAPLSAQIQARRIAETNRTLDEARDALIGYALRNTNPSTSRPHLPCPAGNNGIELDRDGLGNCPTQEGWFPWVTLGAASQDAWGNRLRYRVANGFSSSDGYGNTDMGNIQICDALGCATIIANNIAAVVVSYGPNGWGALNVNGNTLAAPASLNEQENTNNNTVFASRIPNTAGSPSGEFDDRVLWLSADVLRTRTCPTGTGCP